MLIDTFQEIMTKITGIIYKMTGVDWQKERVGVYLKYQPQLDAISKLVQNKNYFLGYLTLADFYIAEYTYALQRVVGPEFNARYQNLIRLRERV